MIDDEMEDAMHALWQGARSETVIKRKSDQKNKRRNNLEEIHSVVGKGPRLAACRTCMFFVVTDRRRSLQCRSAVFSADTTCFYDYVQVADKANILTTFLRRKPCGRVKKKARTRAFRTRPGTTKVS